MKMLNRTELKNLMQFNEQPCVSIFLPTEKVGTEIEKNKIQLKNLIKESEEKLKKTSMLEKEIPKLLAPIEKLLDDNMFWSYQNDGLAMFITKGEFYYYQLPIKFEKLTVVSKRFHVKPLLSLFNNNGQFYVLALSQHEVRLIECSQFGATEIKLEDMPANISEALKYDEQEKQLQFHTGTAGGTGGNVRSAMFHGQDVDHKNDILRYFRQINASVVDFLKECKAPLILAGVDYLLSIYKEANDYQGLLEEGLIGNPEKLSTKEIRDEVWNIVEPYFEEKQKQASALYMELSGTDQASNDIEKIVPAAYNGRVKQLMISTGIQQWGEFVSEKNAVELHDVDTSSSIDLIDFAATCTFLTGGDVFIVGAEDIPEGKPYAAILRY